MKQKPVTCSILFDAIPVALLAFFCTVAHTRAETFETSSWEVVGQFGGPTQAVAVEGNYAYVGVGLGWSR